MPHGNPEADTTEVSASDPLWIKSGSRSRLPVQLTDHVQP